MMKREFTNKIRFLMEDVLPPIVRDSSVFGWCMHKAFPMVQELADFRAHAHEADERRYSDVYQRLERVHADTDNSGAILKATAAQVVGARVCDIGCGTGYTLVYMRTHLAERPGMEMHGVDFQVSAETKARYPEITFHEAAIETLPFEDNAFDTVICTHTLEHILDIRKAVAELRRICRKRLILVVPREREGKYTFNPHLHFFPYPYSFLRVLIPLPQKYTIQDIGRDLFYVEEIA